MGKRNRHEPILWSFIMMELYLNIGGEGINEVLSVHKMKRSFIEMTFTPVLSKNYNNNNFIYSFVQYI